MSIKTIMERYAKGLPISNGLTPIYEDDDHESNGINPRTLDLVDLQEIRRMNNDKIEYLQEEIKHKKSNKKQPNNSEETVSEEQ